MNEMISEVLEEGNDLHKANLISFLALSHTANREVCQQTEN